MNEVIIQIPTAAHSERWN